MTVTKRPHRKHSMKPIASRRPAIFRGFAAVGPIWGGLEWFYKRGERC